MGHPTGVHQLHDDFSTPGMDGVGDAFPALNLRLVEQAGNPRTTQTVGARRGAFGDDQTRRSAPGSILGHQGVGGVGVDRPVAGHGRHDQAVAQWPRAQQEGFVKPGAGLGEDRWRKRDRCDGIEP
jgi:hypothetical protein